MEALDALLRAAGVRTVAVDEAQVAAARRGWPRHGRGRGPAALNYGDCFSYALATVSGRPLLFVGHDFARTEFPAA